MNDERQTPANRPFDLLMPGSSVTAAFADFLSRQRWYGGKADILLTLEIPTCIPVQAPGLSVFLFLIRIRYASGRVEQYALPLKVLSHEQSSDPAADASHLLIVEPEGEAPHCVFSDALEDKPFARLLLESIRNGVSLPGDDAQLVARPTEALGRLVDLSGSPLEPSVMRVEQSNTSIKFGTQLILKFFRRVEEGVNLDVETGIFLTTQAHFEHTPPVAGSIEIRQAGRPSITLGVLQGFVQNQGDAWKYTLQALADYFGRTAGLAAPDGEDGIPPESLHRLASEDPPPRAGELIGTYLSSATLLGRRTAELHLALSSDVSDPRFAPEPFSSDDRQRVCNSMEQLAAQAFQLLEARFGVLELPVQEKGRRVLSYKQDVISRFRQLLTLPVTGCRTRLHGDYHLGQVLFTGTDFVIIDFEGEPERPLAERRAKRSPLLDVAGMIRSFHYAASTALQQSRSQSGHPAGQPASSIQCRWAQYWKLRVSACFLRGYLAAAGSACFIPQNGEELRALLDIFLLEKAVYEVIYEIKNRPAWVEIPLDGILELLA